MKHLLHAGLSAVLAGIAIGIGGALYLSVDSSVVGALLFTVGLYSICVHGLHLFTGKIGYFFDEDAKFRAELPVILLGNFLGTGAAALLLRATRAKKIAERAAELCDVKVKDSLGSLFILAVFCGLLMYIAVDGYKKTQNPILLYACVSAFILCGFEHCIADMFYFSMAGMWNGATFLRILFIVLGNAVGGVLIPLCKKAAP